MDSQAHYVQPYKVPGRGPVTPRGSRPDALLAKELTETHTPRRLQGWYRQGQASRVAGRRVCPARGCSSPELAYQAGLQRLQPAGDLSQYTRVTDTGAAPPPGVVHASSPDECCG